MQWAIGDWVRAPRPPSNKLRPARVTAVAPHHPTVHVSFQGRMADAPVAVPATACLPARRPPRPHAQSIAARAPAPAPVVVLVDDVDGDGAPPTAAAAAAASCAPADPRWGPPSRAAPPECVDLTLDGDDGDDAAAGAPPTLCCACNLPPARAFGPPSPSPPATPPTPSPPTPDSPRSPSPTPRSCPASPVSPLRRPCGPPPASLHAPAPRSALSRSLRPAPPRDPYVPASIDDVPIPRRMPPPPPPPLTKKAKPSAWRGRDLDGDVTWAAREGGWHGSGGEREDADVIEVEEGPSSQEPEPPPRGSLIQSVEAEAGRDEWEDDAVEDDAVEEEGAEAEPQSQPPSEPELADAPDTATEVTRARTCACRRPSRIYRPSAPARTGTGAVSRKRSRAVAASPGEDRSGGQAAQRRRPRTSVGFEEVVASGTVPAAPPAWPRGLVGPGVPLSGVPAVGLVCAEAVRARADEVTEAGATAARQQWTDAAAKSRRKQHVPRQLRGPAAKVCAADTVAAADPGPGAGGNCGCGGKGERKGSKLKANQSAPRAKPGRPRRPKRLSDGGPLKATAAVRRESTSPELQRPAASPPSPNTSVGESGVLSDRSDVGRTAAGLEPAVVAAPALDVAASKSQACRNARQLVAAPVGVRITPAFKPPLTGPHPPRRRRQDPAQPPPPRPQPQPPTSSAEPTTGPGGGGTAGDDHLKRRTRRKSVPAKHGRLVAAPRRAAHYGKGARTAVLRSAGPATAAVDGRARELTSAIHGVLHAPDWIGAAPPRPAGAYASLHFRLWSCGCGVAEKVVGGAVQCAGCYEWTHGLCSGLCAAEFTALAAGRKAYMCFSCSECATVTDRGVQAPARLSQDVVVGRRVLQSRRPTKRVVPAVPVRAAQTDAEIAASVAGVESLLAGVVIVSEARPLFDTLRRRVGVQFGRAPAREG